MSKIDKKILWFDTETTGLSAYKNDIIQIAGMITVNGKIEEEFSYNVQPHNFNNIEPEAVRVHGITEEQMKTFMETKELHGILKDLFKKFINPFDKKDKFTAAGYNVRFDMDMLFQFFKKCGDNYFYSFVDGYPLDVYQGAIILKHFGVLPQLPDYKLETVAKYLGIEIKAHDALSDIQATRETAKALRSFILKKGE